MVSPAPWLRVRVIVLPMFPAQTTGVDEALMLAFNKEAEKSNANIILSASNSSGLRLRLFSIPPSGICNCSGC
jgi:hypothetical protein